MSRPGDYVITKSGFSVKEAATSTLVQVIRRSCYHGNQQNRRNFVVERAVYYMLFGTFERDQDDYRIVLVLSIQLIQHMMYSVSR